jgi:hypothetical protein
MPTEAHAASARPSNHGLRARIEKRQILGRTTSDALSYIKPRPPRRRLRLDHRTRFTLAGADRAAQVDAVVPHSQVRIWANRRQRDGFREELNPSYRSTEYLSTSQ